MFVLYNYNIFKFTILILDHLVIFDFEAIH